MKNIIYIGVNNIYYSAFYYDLAKDGFILLNGKPLIKIKEVINDIYHNDFFYNDLTEDRLIFLKGKPSTELGEVVYE